MFSYFVLPRNEVLNKGRFDYRGSLFWAIGIIVLIYGLTMVESFGWNRYVAITIAIGLLLVFFFYKYEKKNKEPLVDMSLFDDPIFLKGNIAKLISFITLIVVTLFLPFYYQDGRGMEPYQVGILMMVMPITISFVAPLSGYLSDKYGYVIFTVGGMALLSANLFMFSRVDLDTPLYLVVASQVLFGVANGMFQSPNNSLVMSVVPQTHLGISGGIIATMRNFGKSFGIALSVTIFSARLKIYTRSFNEQEAFINALSDIFLVASVIAFVGLLICISDVKYLRNRESCEDSV